MVFYAVAGVLIGVNALAMFIFVGTRCNLLMSRQTDGRFVDAVLAFKQMWWYRMYARVVCVVMIIFSVVGSSTASG